MELSFRPKPGAGKPVGGESVNGAEASYDKLRFDQPSYKMPNDDNPCDDIPVDDTELESESESRIKNAFVLAVKNQVEKNESAADTDLEMADTTNVPVRGDTAVLGSTSKANIAPFDPPESVYFKHDVPVPSLRLDDDASIVIVDQANGVVFRPEEKYDPDDLEPGYLLEHNVKPKGGLRMIRLYLNGMTSDRGLPRILHRVTVTEVDRKGSRSYYHELGHRNSTTIKLSDVILESNYTNYKLVIEAFHLLRARKAELVHEWEERNPEWFLETDYPWYERLNDAQVKERRFEVKDYDKLATFEVDSSCRLLRGSYVYRRLVLRRALPHEPWDEPQFIYTSVASGKVVSSKGIKSDDVIVPESEESLACLACFLTQQKPEDWEGPSFTVRLAVANTATDSTAAGGTSSRSSSMVMESASPPPSPPVLGISQRNRVIPAKSAGDRPDPGLVPPTSDHAIELIPVDTLKVMAIQHELARMEKNRARRLAREKKKMLLAKETQAMTGKRGRDDELEVEGSRASKKTKKADETAEGQGQESLTKSQKHNRRKMASKARVTTVKAKEAMKLGMKAAMKSETKQPMTTGSEKGIEEKMDVDQIL